MFWKKKIRPKILVRGDIFLIRLWALNNEHTRQQQPLWSHCVPCGSCNSSYICNLSWQQASLIIDKRVTKIEQNPHHCALQYSDQRTNWSIVNPLPISHSGAGSESTMARNDLKRSQRSAGIPRPWRGGSEWGKWGRWGGDGEASGMICVGPGVGKVAPGRPESDKTPNFVPSVSLPACLLPHMQIPLTIS